MKGYLADTFSASTEINIWFLFFSLSVWWITCIDLYVTASMQCWRKSHLVWVSDLFDELLGLISFAID